MLARLSADGPRMRCSSCGAGGAAPTAFQKRRRPGGLSAWSRAAAKYASARLRDAGLAETDPRAQERLRVCATCPLRVEHGGVAHCGRPMHLRPFADPHALPGCGCPLSDKARDPSEHCPLDDAEAAAGCRCRWCTASSRRADVLIEETEQN